MTKKQIEEKLAPVKITYKELKEMYRERDINFTDDKEVRMGIDKEIPDQHVDGKTVGLVSFKTYIQGEAARVAKEYQKTTDSATIEKSKIDAESINMDHPQFIRKMRTDD
jgi:hypothetical protein